MKKRLFSLLFSVAMLTSLFSGVVSAEEQKGNPESVVRKIQLEPLKASEELKVSIEELADGTKRKIISGSGNASDGPVRYTVDVDLESNTYNVTKTDLSNDPNYQKTLQPFAPLWNKQIKLLTYDPPGWDLAYTKVMLYWYEQNDYAIYSTGGSATWAANPSPINTHWYVDYEDSRRNDKPDGTGVGQSATGSFSNYDFLDRDKWTYVDHDVYVWGFKNARFEYDAVQRIEGEADLLLSSKIEIY